MHNLEKERMENEQPGNFKKKNTPESARKYTLGISTTCNVLNMEEERKENTQP